MILESYLCSFVHEQKLHNFRFIDVSPSILNNAHYGIYLETFKICTLEPERFL